MSLDIKLSQDQLPKVIQLCGFLGKALGNEVIYVKNTKRHS